MTGHVAITRGEKLDEGEVRRGLLYTFHRFANERRLSAAQARSLAGIVRNILYSASVDRISTNGSSPVVARSEPERQSALLLPVPSLFFASAIGQHAWKPHRHFGRIHHMFLSAVLFGK